MTVCHSGTRDLNFHTRRADILVAAIGNPQFVTGDMVRPRRRRHRRGHQSFPRRQALRRCGFRLRRDVAGAITPVPGGVGPMTITMLLANTVGRRRAARKA